MALAFSQQRPGPAPANAGFDVTADYYLTDGEGLYRTLGRTADATEMLVCVEDCGTLDVLLVPLDTVLAMRPVARAA